MNKEKGYTGGKGWNGAKGEGEDTKGIKGPMDSWKATKARKNPMAEQTVKGTKQPKSDKGWC